MSLSSDSHISKQKLKSASNGLLDLKTELLRAQSQAKAKVSASSNAKSKKLDPKFILPPSDSTPSSHSTSKKHKKRDPDTRNRDDSTSSKSKSDSKRPARRSKNPDPEPDWAHIQASLEHKSKVYDSLVESGAGAHLELARARGELPESDGPLIDFVAKRYDQIVVEEAKRKERKRDKERRRRRGRDRDSDGSSASDRSRSRSRSPTERHRRRHDRRDRYRHRSHSRSRSRSRDRRRRRRSTSPDDTIFAGRSSRAVRDRYISDSAASDAESLVEIEDEFGRTRRVPRSLAHQYDPNLAPPTHSDSESDSDADAADDNISRYFAFTPLPDLPHYESTREVRTVGAGFYQLAQDDDARKAQIQELRALRAETLAARRAKADEVGVESLDVVKPEVAGLHDDPELDPGLEVDEERSLELEGKVADAGRVELQHEEGKAPLDARLIRRVRLVMRRRIKLLGVDKARQVEWTVPVPESVYEDLFVSMANERPLSEQRVGDCATMDVDE